MRGVRYFFRDRFSGFCGFLCKAVLALFPIVYCSRVNVPKNIFTMTEDFPPSENMVSQDHLVRTSMMYTCIPLVSRLANAHLSEYVLGRGFILSDGTSAAHENDKSIILK